MPHAQPARPVKVLLFAKRIVTIATNTMHLHIGAVVVNSSENA